MRFAVLICLAFLGLKPDWWQRSHAVSSAHISQLESRSNSGPSSPAPSPSYSSGGGSPVYSYKTTPSPERTPPPPRFRPPYPRQETYNVRTNLRHEIWKSSPGSPKNGASSTARPRTESSSPPRKRLKMVETEALSGIHHQPTSPSHISSGARTSPSASPVHEQNVHPVHHGIVAGSEKPRKGGASSLLKKGLKMLTGCLGKGGNC